MHAGKPSAEELVLAFLTEAEGEPVAPEAIAGKLDMLPAELFRAVESLRKRGCEIEALPGRGYRLVAAPDRAGSAEIGPLLTTRELGWAIHHHAVIGSTNDEAVSLARDGAAHGEVVIADRQTAGRGRRGRVWASPPRVNLHLSAILRPKLPPQRAPELVAVVAVAAAETLRDLGVSAGIKWPNDLEAEGRKIAGILLDLSADAGRIHFVVAGIGINLNATRDDLPEELRGIATSVRQEVGAIVSRAEVAASLLAHLETWLDRFEEEGFAPVRSRYRELSSILGHPVRLTEPDRTLDGIAEEIDEAGALIVRLPDGGTERFLSGDVTSLRKRTDVTDR
ncbi:biotin--[acetyl-CoA-carboxylase] ligase [Vulgatibacter incomptus]|uniref:Bifunctional ligase/repressor BirA n=1 Tax=Vulgatibacter incomptus TaxID=1391653 RepID=A0A0K1PDS9_9BACT|nr:biotin--[acetyl-CoA-carboxylase] ligase [Vulgatibacter incomptus]AKU91675.1 Biotin operon repressor / Biotin-protein ligase [Vulgatibacter incomptus]